MCLISVLVSVCLFVIVKYFAFIENTFIDPLLCDQCSAKGMVLIVAMRTDRLTPLSLWLSRENRYLIAIHTNVISAEKVFRSDKRA